MADLKVRLKYSRSERDDWTKIEDKALRKKIQNRLAKRKSRVSGPKNKKGRKNDLQDGFSGVKETSDIAETSREEASATEDISSWADMTHDAGNMSSTALPVTLASRGSHVDEVTQSIASRLGLAEHRYISLIEYSVLRAFIQNADLLTMDPYIFLDEDAISPWTTATPYPTLTPHDLSPTPLQLSTPHHPWLDVIGPRSLRDNIILSMMTEVMTEEQENQLCFEMHRGSFMIWGSQPWNAFGWEVSQAFVTNWAWLVDDEMIRCSNFWRAERGESPLIVPDLRGSILGEVI